MTSDADVEKPSTQYPPRYYRELDQAALCAFMQTTGLGTLTTFQDQRFQVTALPFLVKPEPGRITLLGHMPKANPQSRFRDAAGMVMFHGPQAYVSPSWYPTKRTDPRVVPTWDYINVCAEGRLEIIDDPDHVLSHVGELADYFEAGQSEPWSILDAPATFNRSQADRLVGLRFHVEQLSGIWKIHQNHPQQNRLAIIDGLRATGQYGALGIADAMELRELRLAKSE